MKLYTKNDMIAFAKFHVKQALLEASQKATFTAYIKYTDPYDYSSGIEGTGGWVNEESIINAYPESNITINNYDKTNSNRIKLQE